jgi:DNA-binding beta-propeller fold protein YncE
MVARSSRIALLLACLLALAGCAETRYVMQTDPGAGGAAQARVWPEAPETPRYRYAGQLLGEENFVAENGDSRGNAAKLLRWLVGLVGSGQDKITLKRPQSGAVDAAGRVYVSDASNHAVMVFDRPAGKLLVWEMATARRRFVTPVGVAIGAGGSLLVADAELGLVVRLDHDGKPVGSFGQGILTRPTGLARDSVHGRIYVADTHAHDIKVFGDDGVLQQVIGRRGEADGELNFPTHLALGGERLYVADSMNARVALFALDGKPAGTLGRRGLYIGNLSRPKGVTVDSAGNLYVVESYYDSLLVFNGQGQFLMPIGGTGKEIGQFYLPAGAWSDAHGRVYVADMFNGRVMIFQFLGGS